MSIAPFHHLFPERAHKEIRSITVQGVRGLPDGQYGFLELYCIDPACDCRRVLISVISQAHGAILATINYGWESVAFYTKWLRSAEDAAACRGVSLDPLNPQTIYASILLTLFEDCLQDSAYEQRLRTHYGLVKQAVQSKRRATPSATRGKKRRKK